MNNPRRNMVIYNPRRKRGHVESFFFKINNPRAQYGLWIKFTILGPEGGRQPAVAGVWATRIVRGDDGRTLGIRNSLPLDQCRCDLAEEGMTVGACSFGRKITRGRLRDEMGNAIEWDIRFEGDSDPEFLYPYPWMYTAPLPRFKAATPYPDLRAAGWFSVNGKKMKFADLPAMQGHNWGSAHSPHYAWTHCNAFENASGAVFEALSARVEAGGFLTPFLSMAVLRHAGTTYRFDTLKNLLTKDIAMTRRSYAFKFQNDEYELSGVVAAHPHDFAGLMYPNPDFSHRLCVNSNVANSVVELSHRNGPRITRLESAFGAMLELVSPENWPDVCIQVPPFVSAEKEAGALLE